MSKDPKLKFKRHGGKTVGTGSLWAPIPVDYTKIDLDRTISISILFFSIKKIEHVLSTLPTLPDTIILIKETASISLYLVIKKEIKQKFFMDLENLFDPDLKNFCQTHLITLSTVNHTFEIKIILITVKTYKKSLSFII